MLGRTADGADTVVAVDGQLGVGHVDGDGLAGVDPGQRDLLADDHDDAAVGGATLDRDWRGAGLGWWPGGAGGA